MMGPKKEAQAALFFEFLLGDHVPADQMRQIDRFADLDPNPRLSGPVSKFGGSSVD